MTIRLPEVTISIVPGYQKQINQQQKVLFVEQMLDSGTATPGVLYKEIDNANEQTALFGAGSYLDLGIRAFKKYNKLSRVDVMPLVDIDAVAAAGSVLFTAGTSSSDNIIITIAGTPYTYAAGSSDSPTVIAGALKALINADSGCPVSADNTAGLLNLTAKIVGSAGNSITVIVNVGTTGATYTLTAMHGGVDASAQASGTIVFSGTAEEAGTLTVIAGSSINNKYTLEVADTETADAIGSALAAAINADTLSPVTAVNTTGSVALTAKSGGSEGNYISLKVSGIVDSITYTVTAMSGGSINPILTNIFDVIGTNRYQTIVWPQSYTLSILTALLDSRFNVDNNILDGVGIICATDTVANLKILGNATNNKNITYIGDKKVADTYYKGSRILELDYVKASQFAAIRSLRLTDGADISSIVISNTKTGSKDGLGGMSIASLPYFNTPLINLPIVELQYDFTDNEIADLLATGVSVLGNNIALNSIIAGQFVTNYKTDAGGNADATFKYLEYIDTASNIREYFFNNARTRFSQSRLTNGDVIPHRNMANASIISAYFDELYRDLAVDYVLTQWGKDETTGVEMLAYFKANKTVTLDLELGKATVTMIVPIVTQLRKILVTMQIGFSTNT